MRPANMERYVRSIFVQNIPAGVTEDLFRQMLTRFGPLVHFHMFLDSSTSNNPLEKMSPPTRAVVFAEFASNEVAQTVINQLNGLDLGGFRLTADLLSKQGEHIINLFDQLCPTMITAITSTNKNDPRLAGSLSGTTNQMTAPTTTTQGSMGSVQSLTTDFKNSMNNQNKEEKESISNAVASLPPAQMFELMKQMKRCIEANPNEAKTLLLTNPQLAYALLQAQVVMRIVKPEVAMTLLDRTDKDVIPTANDMKKSLSNPTQPTAAVTAPINLPNPAAPFPFPVIPGAPFTMPMMTANPANPQQAVATAALLQAALLSGSGMFPGSLIGPPMTHTAAFPSMQNPFPTPLNPLSAGPIRPPNLDENAALLLLQLDDSQLAHLSPAQSMQIRSLREQIAKTGLLPKM